MQKLSVIRKPLIVLLSVATLLASADAMLSFYIYRVSGSFASLHYVVAQWLNG